MVSFILTCLGSLSLCMGMPKHFRQFFVGRKFKPSQNYAFLGLGYFLLACAIYASALSSGVALGLVLFVAYLNVAIFGIALFLAFKSSIKSG